MYIYMYASLDLNELIGTLAFNPSSAKTKIFLAKN